MDNICAGQKKLSSNFRVGLGRPTTITLSMPYVKPMRSTKVAYWIVVQLQDPLLSYEIMKCGRTDCCISLGSDTVL